MKFLLVLSFLTIQGALFSQDNFFVRYEEEQKVCPEDSSIVFTGINNWEVFQTSDNSIYGERINTCANLEFSNFNRVHLPLNNIDPTRTIFVKNINPLQGKIDANKIFEASASSRFDGAGEFGEPLEGRSSLFLLYIDGIGVDGDTIRNEFFIQNDESSQPKYLGLRDCVLTEKQDSQFVNEICYFMEISNFTDSSKIQIPGFYMYSYQWIDITFTNGIVSNNYFQNGIYVPDPWNSFNISKYENTSVLHKSPGDPGPDNMHYYNVQVEDSLVQHTIDLNLTEGYNILFQTYTQIRGALVAGQDSLRHKFNLNLDGGSMCLRFAIDLITEDGNEFRYKSGTLNFNALNACMQFQGGSKLRVMENARFHYGKNGVGLLSLKPGSEVVIEDGAELIMDGNILLSGYRDSEPIKIVLEPGQKLSFTPNAHIYPLIDEYYFKQIDVYLNGGELDTQYLDAQSLSRLNIIHGTSSFNSKSVHIFPNPSSDFIAIENSNYPGSMKISMVNLSGQSVGSAEGNTQYLNLDVRNLENGNYIITGDGMESQKIVVMH